MIFRVTLQQTDTKDMGFCKVIRSQDGNAILMNGESGGELSKIKKTKVASMNESGFTISGFAVIEGGIGGKRFVKQEWLCKYVDLEQALMAELSAQPGCIFNHE